MTVYKYPNVEDLRIRYHHLKRLSYKRDLTFEEKDEFETLTLAINIFKEQNEK